jgi:hypothetical protein
MTTTTLLPRFTPATPERCDRCPAAARVRADLARGGELLFCAHHAREHEMSLLTGGATLIDIATTSLEVRRSPRGRPSPAR